MSVGQSIFTFSGPLNTGVIPAVIANYPGITFTGQEAGAQYRESREISIAGNSGFFFATQNAFWNGAAWQQSNASLPSYSIEQDQLGNVNFLSVPAFSSPWTAWTQYAQIGNTGNSTFTGSAGIYNVKVYGAIGNGVADDTVAINSAISAASAAGGGQVFFPAGTYLIGAAASSHAKIAPANNISIQGSGSGVTTWLFGSSGTFNGGFINSTTAYKNLSIQDITFNMNGNTTDGNIAIWLQQTGQNNVWVRRCQFIGQNSSSQALAIGYPTSTTNSAGFVVPSLEGTVAVALTNTLGTSPFLQVGQYVRTFSRSNQQVTFEPLVGIITATNGLTTMTIQVINQGAYTVGGTVPIGTGFGVCSYACGVEDCYFLGNNCGTFAVCEMYGQMAFHMNNCTFSNNSHASTIQADLEFYSYNTDCVVGDCIFSSNQSGDIIVLNSDGIQFNNCIHRGPYNTANNNVSVKVANSQNIVFNSPQMFGIPSMVAFGIGDLGGGIIDGNPLMFNNSGMISINNAFIHNYFFAIQCPNAQSAQNNFGQFDIIINNPIFDNISNIAITLAGTLAQAIKGFMVYNPRMLNSGTSVPLFKVTGNTILGTSVSTTLNGGASSGQPNVTVASGTGIVNGKQYIIDYGNATSFSGGGSNIQELVTVSSGGGTASIVLTSNLLFNHSSGAAFQSADSIYGTSGANATNGLTDVVIRGASHDSNGVAQQGVSLVNALNVRILDYDFTNVTSPIVTSGTVSFTIKGSLGYAPGAALGTPGIPLTTVALQNVTGVDQLVNITNGVNAMTVNFGPTNATATTLFVIPVSGIQQVLLPAGSWIKLTYAGGAPTWQWYAAIS